jgi:hypothetical protein
VGSHDPLFTHGVGGTIRPATPVFSRASARVRRRAASCSAKSSDANRLFRRVACNTASRNRGNNQDDTPGDQHSTQIERQNRRNNRYGPLSPFDY